MEGENRTSKFGKVERVWDQLCFICQILGQISLWKNYLFLHFIDEETAVQSGYETHQEMGFEPRQSDSQAHAVGYYIPPPIIEKNNTKVLEGLKV